MEFSSLILKPEEPEVVVAQLNDQQEIEVLSYLPVRDKIDLIQIALQKSFENGVYNDIKLDVYFNLNIVYLYTNLTFTPEEKEDEFALYDKLEKNGIIIRVLGAMPDKEYEDLLYYLKKMRKANERHNRSAVALFTTLVQDLPQNMEAVAEILNNFDPEKYEKVVSFAEAANAGRPVPKTIE